MSNSVPESFFNELYELFLEALIEYRLCLCVHRGGGGFRPGGFMSML